MVNCRSLLLTLREKFSPGPRFKPEFLTLHSVHFHLCHCSGTAQACRAGDPGSDLAPGKNLSFKINRIEYCLKFQNFNIS